MSKAIVSHVRPLTKTNSNTGSNAKCFAFYAEVSLSKIKFVKFIFDLYSVNEILTISGYGRGFPCRKDDVLGVMGQQCEDCKKTFYNVDCYLRHLKDDICNKFHQCENPKCMVIWNRERFLKNEKPEHKCDDKFCTKCSKFSMILRLTSSLYFLLFY